ncbi:hypothetical protein CCP2SC5_170027 [Azospirillaceae bacterium]
MGVTGERVLIPHKNYGAQSSASYTLAPYNFYENKGSCVHRSACWRHASQCLLVFDGFGVEP